MVKLTMELIAKGSMMGGMSGDGRGFGSLPSPKGGGSGGGGGGNSQATNEQSYLKKLTHLYLQDKNIEEISGLSTCKNLLVLYLYDNKLTTVPYLGFAKSLTHLYLQNNAIDRMNNFRELKSLTKLYIGGNQIIVIEGIEACDKLKELHVEQQQLPPGEKIIFDPRSFRGIADSLEVLNVSGDRLESLDELTPLLHLRHLMANDNFLESANEVAEVLSGFNQLDKAELLGNPCVSKARYRERVVEACPLLQTLDGKEITTTTRRFVTSLATRRRDAKKEADKRQMTRADTLTGSRGGGGESQQMAASVGAPETEKSGYGDTGENGTIVPSYVMPRLPHRRFEEVLARSQTMPPTDGERNRPSERMAKSGKTKLSVVNYVGPGASAFMADPNDDRLRTSIALKAAYDAATELPDQRIGGGEGNFGVGPIGAGVSAGIGTGVGAGAGAGVGGGSDAGVVGGNIGGGGGMFMGAVRKQTSGGVASGHR